jgi:hypothetical protein
MEFSKANLTKAVFYILTLHPNKKFSNVEMLNEIEDENVCPELTDSILTRNNRVTALVNINQAMLKASTEYNNVFFLNNKCYLKQKNKYVADLEPLIMSETPKSLVDLNGYRNDEDDSLLHILCKNGEDELIQSLSRYHKIDLNMRNSKGESVLDVVCEDEKVLKSLLKIVVQQTQDNNNLLEATLLRNNELMSANSDLVECKQQMEMKNAELFKWTMYMFTLLVLIFAVVIGYVGSMFTSA